MVIDRTPWTGDTVYPWEQHKGKAMKDVPAEHLMWLLEQPWIRDWPGCHAYLETRRDELIQLRAKDPLPYDSTSYDDYLRDYRGF